MLCKVIPINCTLCEDFTNFSNAAFRRMGFLLTGIKIRSEYRQDDKNQEQFFLPKSITGTDKQISYLEHHRDVHEIKPGLWPLNPQTGIDDLHVYLGKTHHLYDFFASAFQAVKIKTKDVTFWSRCNAVRGSNKFKCFRLVSVNCKQAEELSEAFLKEVAGPLAEEHCPFKPDNRKRLVPICHLPPD